jgi:hypothetical protein
MAKKPNPIGAALMRYALVKTSDNSINRFDTSVEPNVQTKAGFAWRACPDVARPSFDPATEVVEGPTYTVGASSVTEVWTKRSLTAQEISDRKDAKIGSIDALQFSVMFDMENRVRVLESKPAVTAAQYRAALKARL